MSKAQSGARARVERIRFQSSVAALTPKERFTDVFAIKVNVSAVFDSAAASGLDTIVDEAKSKNELKGIDIKKT